MANKYLNKAKDSANFLVTDLLNANSEADKVLHILLMDLIKKSVEIEDVLKQITEER